MNILFNITVVFLQILARIFGTNYVTVNILFYCIVGPLFFLTLMLILWAETTWSILQNQLLLCFACLEKLCIDKMII